MRGIRKGFVNSRVKADEVNSRALESLGHKIVAVALVATNSASRQRDTRIVDNGLHVPSPSAEPVTWVVVRSLIFGLLKRLILNVESKDGVTPLAPSFPAARRLIVQHVSHASIIPRIKSTKQSRSIRPVSRTEIWLLRWSKNYRQPSCCRRIRKFFHRRRKN